MKNISKILFALFIAVMLTACGEKVEIPPATVGKIVIKRAFAQRRHSACQCAGRTATS